MNKSLALAIALALLSSACATPRQMSRSEWLETAQRQYPGIVKDDVIAAGERVLRFADGNDFVIQHAEDGFVASRNWLVYVVIGAAAGTDYWRLVVTPTDAGTKASIQVSTQMQTIAPMATVGANGGAGGWSAATMPLAGAPVDGTALYDVFWARMEYMLGLRANWMTCDMADARVKLGITWGNNEALCNSFNMHDITPSAAARVRKFVAK